MKRFVFFQLCLSFVVIFVTYDALAQKVLTHVSSNRSSFQYAVKFICGEEKGKILAPGRYYTAINIHNPTDTTISFMYKAVPAFPGQPGPVSQFAKMALRTDEAIEIDCQQVSKLTGGKREFFKGFVIIYSSCKLDVVAVYTAGGADKQVVTMDVEPIPAQPLSELARCPDLTVISIDKPVWDSIGKRSIIKATIKNIGNEIAGKTFARLIDPTTLQYNGGPPYGSVADTPSLAPGATAIVTFYLPYWVYNPDATLEVTADYKQDLTECDESNNVKVFEDQG